jgi:hypothetical protein
MNTLKVTFTDGSSYTTSANSTAKEFEAYLTQFGRSIVIDESDDGKETRKTIERVSKVCACGNEFVQNGNFTDGSFSFTGTGTRCNSCGKVE